MQLDFYQVDAFSQAPFSGNPAMVYRLTQWLDDQLMQRIAAEHNLAETAFVVGQGEHWQIRWFTPKAEVPLCGHATLASAHVLFEQYAEAAVSLEFASLSGPLRVSREGARLVLDFPVRRAEVLLDNELHQAIEQALGQPVQQVQALLNDGVIGELFIVLEDEAQLRSLNPDMAALAKLPGLGLLASAAGVKHDFVSRYFAPSLGIDEDPVTGSTHCILTPYWAQRLGKNRLSAYQCSARGGELMCELAGERVKIAGHAVLVARGQLLLP